MLKRIRSISGFMLIFLAFMAAISSASCPTSFESATPAAASFSY
jgi:hypothetical protein